MARLDAPDTIRDSSWHYLISPFKTDPVHSEQYERFPSQ